MGSPIKLAHVVLRTGRVAEMRDWYLKVLEARVAYEAGPLCFITYDEEHHRLAFIDPGVTEAPGPKTSGLEHVAFTYRELGDLLATWERLKAEEITPEWAVNHGPTTSFYYKDPDGNRVELQVDNFADSREADRYMASPAFAKNPIGVAFEPADLLARLRSGAPISELLAPPPEGVTPAIPHLEFKLSPADPSPSPP